MIKGGGQIAITLLCWALRQVATCLWDKTTTPQEKFAKQSQHVMNRIPVHGQNFDIDM